MLIGEGLISSKTMLRKAILDLSIIILPNLNLNLITSSVLIFDVLGRSKTSKASLHHNAHFGA